MTLSNVGQNNKDLIPFSSDKKTDKSENENGFMSELYGMIELSVKSSDLPESALINSEIGSKDDKSELESLNFLATEKGNLIDLSNIEKLKSIASKLKMANNSSQQNNIDNNIVFNFKGEHKLFEEIDLDQIKNQTLLIDKYGSTNSKVNLENHPKIKLIRETTKDLIQQHRDFLAPFKEKLGLIDEINSDKLEMTDPELTNKINEVKESNKSFFSNLKEKLNTNVDVVNPDNKAIINLNIDGKELINDIKNNSTANLIDNGEKTLAARPSFIDKSIKVENKELINVINKFNENNSEIKPEIKLELNKDLINNKNNLLKESPNTNNKLVDLINKYSETNNEINVKNSSINPLISNKQESSGLAINNELSEIINKYNNKDIKLSEGDNKSSTLVENKDEISKFGMENNNSKSGDNSTSEEKLFTGKKLVELFLNGKISADSFNKNLSELKQVSNEIKVNAKEYIIYKDVQAKNIASNTANSIGNLTPNGNAVLKMNLNPTNLGNVFVEISVINNVASLNFKSETKETLKLIEHQINGLVEKLNSQGITTDSISLTQNQEDKQELLNNGKYFDKGNKEQKDRQEYFESLKNLALLNELKS